MTDRIGGSGEGSRPLRFARRRLRGHSVRLRALGLGMGAQFGRGAQFGCVGAPFGIAALGSAADTRLGCGRPGGLSERRNT